MAQKKLILAFTGHMASGKGTACNYFVENYGAVTVRFSNMLRDVLDRLYLEQNRDNLQKLSLSLRQDFGQDVMAKVIARDVEISDAPLIVVDGVRRPSDVIYLKKVPGFVLIAIAVPQAVRFERLKSRHENPDDERKTWEQFQREEKADAEILIPEIMKQADYTIDNGGDVGSLRMKLEELYKKLSHDH